MIAWLIITILWSVMLGARLYGIYHKGWSENAKGFLLCLTFVVIGVFQILSIYCEVAK